MVDRLSEEEAEEVTNLISGKVVPEVIRIADKFNYDRDSLMKYVANLFSTMAEFATFENYTVSVSENPNKCGVWLDDGFCGDYVCSVCKQEFDCDIVNMRGFDFDLPKFCPNCGAKMKGGEE